MHAAEGLFFLGGPLWAAGDALDSLRRDGEDDVVIYSLNYAGGGFGADGA